MLIKQTVMDERSFLDEFSHMAARHSQHSERVGRFSEDGIKALYKHLSEFDGHYLFNVVSICNEYIEYETIHEYNAANETFYESWDDVIDDTGLWVMHFGTESAIVSEH